MDLVTGCPFWLVKNGFLAVYPPLDADTTCDVAVIGAGITGALIAYHLTEAGLSTVVLDGRDVGFGSTGANTALLQYEPDKTLGQLSRTIGEDAAVRCYRLCRDAVKHLHKLSVAVGNDVGFQMRESLYGASQRTHVSALKREFELRRRHGFDVEFWTRRDVVAASSLPYAAAILSKGAAQTDVFRFTHGLLQRALARGLRVYDRTQVRGYRRRGNGFEIATHRGVRVRARKIVIAAGYEAQRFLRHKVSSIHSTYAIITEPLAEFPGWPGDRLIWETARPYLYLRRADDRAIIGGYDELFQDARSRDALLPAKRTALHRALRRLFPRLKSEVAYYWTGTFAETDDSLPYIGESPDEAGVYFAMGYGGNGVIFSAVAAEILRDLCLGKTHPDAELFRFAR